MVRALNWSLVLVFACQIPAAGQSRLDYAQRRSALIEKEVRAVIGLAQECVKRGLLEEGHGWLDHVLIIDADNEQAISLMTAEPSGVEPTEKDRRDYIRRRDALIRTMVKSRTDLAKWCKQQGLQRQARELIEEVLKFDPDNAAAREACGYTKYDGEWVPNDIAILRRGGRVSYGPFWVTVPEREALKEDKYPVDGVLKPLADVDEIRSNIKTPWSLRTRHFHVTSNLVFPEVERLAVRLEQAYDVLPGVFGLNVAAPPDIYSILWTRSKPDLEAILGAIGSGSHWYRDLTCGTYSELGSSNIHNEAPRLFFECIVNNDSKEGIDRVQVQCGSWAFFGSSRLAERLSATPDGLPFNLQALQLLTGPITNNYLLAHGDQALAKLEARLGSDWGGDFSQWMDTSASFVAYLLFAHDGRHADSFRKYLEGVREGKGSVDLFRTTFGFPISDLMEGFREHVRGM